MLEMPDEWWESVGIVTVRECYNHSYSFAFTSPLPWFEAGIPYFVYLDGNAVRPCGLPSEPSLLVPDKYLFKIQHAIAAESGDVT